MKLRLCVSVCLTQRLLFHYVFTKGYWGEMKGCFIFLKRCFVRMKGCFIFTKQPLVKI
ncbi:MAG: hypothetical protein LBL74_03770 [Bacteroidales bacterium]|nr:hypothetical protein [Bacteroidales bacterium]